MEEKEKTMAQLEARLKSFDQTLSEIKQTAEKRGASLTKDSKELIPKMERMYDMASKGARQLETRQGSGWQESYSKLKHFMDDMDESLRKALAYFS